MNTKSFFFAFFFGVIATIVVLSFLPSEEINRYSFLKGDMLRLEDVRYRIDDSTKPIDVAFIGTSHTWNGVPDELIETKLSNNGDAINVANLASSWMGRDLHFFILKKLLAKKNPKLVLIEITDHEYPFGHEALPYIGGLGDLFCCKAYLDLHFPKNFSLFLKYKYYGFIRSFSHQKKISIATKSEYGWKPMDHFWIGSIESSNSINEKLKRLAYYASSDYGMSAVENMVKTCHYNHIKVAFLYLPEYQYAKDDPFVDMSRYNRLAPIIKLPDSIVNDPKFWSDKAHLNRQGAVEFSQPLAAAIKKIIFNGSNADS